MGFANEYVSREDVEKYGLAEVRLRFRPLDRERPGAYVYKWTVDRSRDVYLMLMSNGRDEHGNRITWALNVKGRLFEIIADLGAEGSSKSYSDRPYKIEWLLVGVKPKPESELERAEVLTLFKEALAVYGDWGPERQIPGTVVSFRF